MSVLARLNLRHNWPLVVAYSALALTIICVSVSFFYTPYFTFIIYPLLYSFNLLPTLISIEIITLITFILVFYNMPDGTKYGWLYSIIAFPLVVGLFYLELHIPNTDRTSPICGLSFLEIALCVVFMYIMFRRKDNRIIKRAVIVLFGVVSFSICAGTFLLFNSKSIDHLSSVYTNSKSYQLAAVSEIDASCRWVSYFLYTCDASGLFCGQGRQVDKGSPNMACYPGKFDPISGKLEFDGENLYLQIGDQKTLIAP